MKSFGYGNIVMHGDTCGILVGVFNNCYGFLFAREPRSDYHTVDEIIRNTNNKISSLFSNFIKEFFRNPNDPTIKNILSQQRFCIVHFDNLMRVKYKDQLEIERLISKRHLMLTMARNYLRTKKPIDKIHSICQNIENIQTEIELLHLGNCSV